MLIGTLMSMVWVNGNRRELGRGRLTLEVKVAEQCNILSALFTLGQRGKNQESLPSFSAKNPQTLEFRGQVIKEGFGDTSAAHSSVGTNMLVYEVDRRKDNADGENPL